LTCALAGSIPAFGATGS